MKMPSEQDLRELLEAPESNIILSAVEMLNILGALQLVLRHPGFAETAPAVTAREFAKELEALITRRVPGMKDLCAAGWNPEMDNALEGEKP